MSVYPGTVVKKGDLSGEQFLQGIFMATNGLVMSQLNEITGIGTPAIQNWVSRGFIARPIDRRYSKDTTARIFIINALRQNMELADIKKLLIYVNGRADDRKDDIIPESTLYSYMCEIVFNKKFAYNTVNELIEDTLTVYEERVKGAKQRLKTALEIICLNYLSSKLQKRSSVLLEQINPSNIFGESL